MNQLVGERLSIITPKAQTTRHRIMGLLNGEDYQIVFSDTPGIVDPAYKLHEGMMNFVFTAMQDADAFLVLVEVGEKKFKNEEVQQRINKSRTPTLLLLNKVDLSNQESLEADVDKWKAEFPNADVLPISALHGFHVDQVMQWIINKLPENPPYFPKDELSDRSERFFASEMIREKIFLHYKKEIPYACEVVVESFKEEEDIIRVRAEIFVERDSQKGILIGKQGSSLKSVGTDARKAMESFFQKKVFLELHVKVDKDWRSNPLKLKRYGYLN
jgi:GTP-binding protein Era